MTAKTLKRWGLEIAGAWFNADSAFDTKAVRKTCFNHGVKPNLAENKRSRKKLKRGRKRCFNATIYKRRFVAERSTIGARCHELRMPDEDKSWRIIYRIDSDAILMVDVFAKTTRQTPGSIMQVCRRRLREYDSTKAGA